MAGFKSFADRTRLEFEPGVSVVVGPNGTGKSNIADATAWVLGSRLTRGLRTDKMEEVIFTGTTLRKPLGRAEVTVVLDNADRALPLDLDEVSITRRLYRDGEAEYEINGVDCRLLDIEELLSDGGIGRRQHLIVGQGRLDQVLGGRGDQRRQIIEEAAGILKHRIRKEKAERRLEKTAADLLRLHDVLAEIERRRRPLRRQSKAAQRYTSVRDQLRAIQKWQGGEELRGLQEVSRRLEEQDQSLQTVISEGVDRLEELEAEATRLSEDQTRLSEEQEQAAGALAQLESLSQRFTGIAQVARERAGALRTRVEREHNQRLHLDEQAARLTEELTQATTEEADVRRQAEVCQTALQAADDQMRSLAEREALPLQGALAMDYGNLRSLEGEQARDRRETDDVRHRIELLVEQQSGATEEKSKVEERIRSTDELITAASQVLKTENVSCARVRSEWEKSEQLLRSAEAAHIAAAAKVEALESSVVGRASPQAVAVAGDTRRVVGSLLELLGVPDDVLVACNAALTGWADALLVSGRPDLSEVVALLKSRGLGGLPLITQALPQDDSDSDEELLPAQTVALRWGVEALVDRLNPGGNRALAEALLADVVLVEGWAGGWEIVGSEPDIRVVTPEGDLITRFGIYLADPLGGTPAALQAALRELEAAEVDETRARRQRSHYREAFQQANAKEMEAQQNLEALEANLAGEVNALDRITRAIATAAEDLNRLESRQAVLQEAASQRGERLEDLREQIGRWEEQEGAEADQVVGQAAQVEQRQEAERRYEQARRAREDSLEALGAAVERRRMLQARSQEMARQATQVASTDSDKNRLGSLQNIEGWSRRAAQAVEVHRQSLQERLEAIRSDGTETARLIEETRNTATQTRDSVEQARQEQAQVAVETTETRMRVETVAETLRREADATQEEALAAPRPELDPDRPEQDLSALAESLQAELARMGPINPLAITEFDELEERRELITGQLADLESSQTELRKVIKALETEMENLFRATFAETSRLYQHYFTILFPGGKGRLVLSDPAQPLESGVEIAAQPWGKKVENLSLLSGGERSLAALAFMFAVFGARPAPFHILDEVDAALDNPNILRFLRLVEEFRGGAQLILITHQPTTMQAADTLYGVTMEPGGSSRAVVKRMEDVHLPV